MPEQHGIGTFSSYEITEAALEELRLNNFVMEQVSVVGLDIHQQTEMAGANTSSHLASLGSLDSPSNKVEDKAVNGAIAGVTVGGFAGLLVGLGGLLIPGIGPIILAGSSAMAIAGLVSGGVLGTIAGGLAGALVGIGIPEDRAEIYSDQIAKGNYLVLVKGTNADIVFAESIFAKHNINNWHIYNGTIRTTTIISTTTSNRPIANPNG